MSGEGERVVRREYHSYSATRETDHGVLKSGAFAGLHFVTWVSAWADTPEEAEEKLARGHTSIRGYEARDPSRHTEESDRE